MNIDEINSLSETEKLIANKIDMVIKYKNRKTMFILGNYFNKLHIEFDFFTKFTLLPDLPTNIGETFDPSHIIYVADDDYRRRIEKGESEKEALRNAISSHVNNQKLYFLIHYPDITVTNENGRSTNVEDLYGLVEMVNNTMLQMYGLVATYSYEKASVGYAFSHLPHIDWERSNSNKPVRFSSCCLGNGPIVTLKSAMVRELGMERYVKDHHILMLAMNIDRYFHVESISGGPYIQMSRIGLNIDGFDSINFINEYSCDNNGFVNSDIFKYMVRDTLFRMANDSKFFVDTTYSMKKSEQGVITRFGFPGFSKPIDEHGFCICFSEYFKKVYVEYSLLYNNLPDTEELIHEGILCKYFESNGKLYKKNRASRPIDFSKFQGQFLFKFKGRDVRLSIRKPSESIENREGIYIDSNLSKVIHSYYRNILCCDTPRLLKNSVV